MLAIFRISSFVSFVFMLARYTVIDTPTYSISPDLDSSGFEGDSCPTGFDLVRNGQCQVSLPDQRMNYLAINQTIELCSKAKGLPVIIRDGEENEYWKGTLKTNYLLPIGILCNYSSAKWQWIDGTPVNYKPPEYSQYLDLPCASRNPGTWFMYLNGDWGFLSDGTYNFKISCISDLSKPKLTNECLDFDHFESESTCYQVSTIAVNWTVAQKYCQSIGAHLASVHNEQDNGFLRRAAFSKGLLNGVLLGASSSVKLNDFKWIDNSEWNYTNFVPGFPMRGYGTCLAMATNSISGQWTNTDCSAKMPFACSRKPFSEGAPKTCLGASVKENDIIVSPGFPLNASMPCDLFLTVPVGGLVEVEIILLEANSCCDRLILAEGSVGGTIIANLTGALNNVKYRTTSMNMMRVSWQPKGGVNVRGLVMTFRGV